MLNSSAQARYNHPQNELNFSPTTSIIKLLKDPVTIELIEEGVNMSEKIKILINYKGEQPLNRLHIQQICEVSDRIMVELATEEKNILDAVEDAEIILGWFNREMFLASKKLKWIHVGSAGVDRLLFPEFVNSQVILTNSSGIHRIPMSEMAVAMMLMFAKKLHKFMRFQLEGRWTQIVPDELAGKTIGVLGLGNVGMETAWKAKCLDMNILALKRESIRRPVYVDEILGPEDLNYLLRESDYLVITMPLTRETHHMIGEGELKIMKPSAYIINVGRGAVIDNAALLKALKEGWIAGAGLDVLEEEPLPEDSEFWRLENVVITPHISGATPYYEDRVVKIFCENLSRYLNDKPLINVVDKKVGY